jgi:energy-converting hydrogenase Eha subunit B
MISQKSPLPLRLLKLIAIAHIVAGIALCLLYFIEPLHSPMLEAVYVGQQDRLANSGQLAFWLCILGPTIASWGVLFLALVHQYFLTPTRFLWNCMLAAILVWAPLDSLLCTLNGIYAGAIGNIAVTIVFLVLLFHIRVLTE